MVAIPSTGGGFGGYSNALAGAQQSYGNILANYGGGGGAAGGGGLAPGGLPFDALAGGGNFDFTGNPANLSSNYKTAYQGALGFNAALGNQINQGWGQLGQNIQGTIQGITASQQQAINDAYAAQQGQATQGLISAGLGNTTVQSSVARGIELDKAKAGIALANQMAGLSAGYQAQIGQGQLGFLNSITAPYPDAGLYGQLGQQWGAAQQGRANQAQAADQFKQLLAASRANPAAGMGGGFMGVGTGGGMSPQNPYRFMAAPGGAGGAGAGFSAPGAPYQPPTSAPGVSQWDDLYSNPDYSPFMGDMPNDLAGAGLMSGPDLGYQDFWDEGLNAGDYGYA